MINLPEGFEDLDGEAKVQAVLDLAKAEEEARKKLEADTSRGVNKLIDETKREKAIAQQARILIKDKNAFADLYQQDPEMAQEVLNEYFDGISCEDALAQVEGPQKAIIQQKGNEQQLTSKINEELNKREVGKAIREFTTNANLSQEQKEAFDKEFAEITEGKNLTDANVDKYLKIAFKEAIPEVDLSDVDKQAREIAIGMGTSGKSKKDPATAIRKDSMDYLRKNGIIQ